jgi:hypothetical protein
MGTESQINNIVSEILVSRNVRHFSYSKYIVFGQSLICLVRANDL